jgi:hypothetical protein
MPSLSIAKQLTSEAKIDRKGYVGKDNMPSKLEAK